MLQDYGVVIYPDQDLHFIPTKLPFFDPFTHDSASMLLDSARTDARIMDLNSAVFTKPHVYFYLLLSAELERYLKPEPNPGTVFAHQYRGAEINELYGKTTVYSDWNERFMGR